MGLRVVVRSRGEAEGPAPDGTSLEFDQERVLVGRALSADVQLPGLSVGARHLSLRAEGARVVAIDHGSVNGTRLNGTPLVPERPRAVRSGDVLEVGSYLLTLDVGAVISQAASRERTLSLARRLLWAELGQASTARLVVLNGAGKGREHALPEAPARLRIGRATTCEIALDDADASREHAELVLDLDGVLVRDLGSKNGIEVNQRRVTEKRLRDRDEILVGATVLSFEDPSEGQLQARAVEPAVPYEPPPLPSAPDPPPAPEAPPEPQLAPVEKPSLPAPAPPARKPFQPGPELFVLLLALVVVALSATGLVLLLGD